MMTSVVTIKNINTMTQATRRFYVNSRTNAMAIKNHFIGLNPKSYVFEVQNEIKAQKNT